MTNLLIAEICRFRPSWKNFSRYFIKVKDNKGPKYVTAVFVVFGLKCFRSQNEVAEHFPLKFFKNKSFRLESWLTEFSCGFVEKNYYILLCLADMMLHVWDTGSWANVSYLRWPVENQKLLAQMLWEEFQQIVSEKNDFGNRHNCKPRVFTLSIVYGFFRNAISSLCSWVSDEALYS